ncbi:MAG: hypothetical protein ACFFFG_10545 [Candidatus Thorarchaeota archaeon]
MKNEREYSLDYAPYRPRTIDFHGIRELKGFQIKTYSVLYGSKPIQWDLFEKGIELASNFLPSSPLAPGRPGLGFLIVHQGLTGNYVVLCWWDRENELPTKVFIHNGNEWQQAQAEESFCVWDLEIFWHEREAYVSTILSRTDSEIRDQYLSQTLRIAV